MDILSKLKEILKEYKGENIDLDENITFDSLGFDSLDKVELLMKIEEEFNITFSDDLKVDTLGELITTINSLL